MFGNPSPDTVGFVFLLIAALVLLIVFTKKAIAEDRQMTKEMDWCRHVHTTIGMKYFNNK